MSVPLLPVVIAALALWWAVGAMFRRARRPVATRTQDVCLGALLVVLLVGYVGARLLVFVALWPYFGHQPVAQYTLLVLWFALNALDNVTGDRRARRALDLDAPATLAGPILPWQTGAPVPTDTVFTGEVR